MNPDSAAPSRRSPAARILSIVLPIVVLGGVGLFLGQSFIPVAGVTDCTVTAIEEVTGGRGADGTLYRTSCGDYYSDQRGIEVGGTYDFELRGLYKTNIVGVEPAS